MKKITLEQLRKMTEAELLSIIEAANRRRPSELNVADNRTLALLELLRRKRPGKETTTNENM